MKISEQEIHRVAELANLELTAEETAQLAHDLSGILTHIDKLNQLDTAGVEPMAHVAQPDDETASLRDDIERPSLSNEDALANAPLAGSGYFKVPKVIER